VKAGCRTRGNHVKITWLFAGLSVGAAFAPALPVASVSAALDEYES